jgi:hypothetical protein
MKLGLNLGYWGGGNDADNLALAKEADALGYAVAWAAEAYGSDVVTVLAWVAAQCPNIDVGSAIFQIPGRTPALTAMTAAAGSASVSASPARRSPRAGTASASTSRWRAPVSTATS